jgi:GTP pyrophosphokinase
MLLAFSRDLRVVLLRLASRLQTLRWHAASKQAVPARAGHRIAAGVRAAGQPAGHLADQVGAGRPGLPLPAARRLPAHRAPARRDAREREPACAPRAPAGRRCWRAPPACAPRCRAGPSTSTASGRRCRARAWPSSGCSTCARCASSSTTCRPATRRWRGCTSAYRPVDGEFDDYIARPSPTATRACTPWCRRRRPAAGGADPHPGDARARRARRGRALDVQGSRRQGLRRRVSASGEFEERWPRRARPCCASCWPGSATSPPARAGEGAARPAARLRRPHLRLHAAGHGHRPAAGGTPVDFAYALHTDLGHRCRGARVDGAMVPLNTPLRSGRRWRSWRPRKAGRRWTGSTPNWATCQPARARQGARLVQRAGAGADHRARPRGGGEAAAARGPHGAQARRPGRAAGLQGRRRAVRGGGQGRVLAAHIENLLRPAEPPPEPTTSRCGAAQRPGGGRAACWWWAWTRC